MRYPASVRFAAGNGRLPQAYAWRWDGHQVILFPPPNLGVFYIVVLILSEVAAMTLPIVLNSNVTKLNAVIFMRIHCTGWGSIIGNAVHAFIT